MLARLREYMLLDGRPKSTIIACTRSVRDLMEDIGKVPLEITDEEAISHLNKYRDEHDLGSSTVNSRICGLRYLYHRVYKETGVIELATRAHGTLNICVVTLGNWRRLQAGKVANEGLFSQILVEEKPLTGIAVELPGGVLLRFSQLPPVGYLREVAGMGPQRLCAVVKAAGAWDVRVAAPFGSRRFDRIGLGGAGVDPGGRVAGECSAAGPLFPCPGCRLKKGGRYPPFWRQCC